MMYKYTVEFEELYHPADDTKQLIHVKFKSKHGVSKEYLNEAIDIATKKFSEYRIFPASHGFMIEGTLGEKNEDQCSN